jgi:Holliday junction resolvasome RuvABC endonuclease subunit
MTALILALDISSAAIGWCLRNSAVVSHGVVRLDPKQCIGARCVKARNEISSLLFWRHPDALAIESPVARFAKAIIPQCRVSGCVLEAAARLGVLACEITPTAAKSALVGDGGASKQQMLEAAAAHFGYEDRALAYVKQRGDWCAVLDGAVVLWEHEADALGIAICAMKMVEVVDVSR